MALFKEKNSQNEDRNQQLKNKLKSQNDSHDKELKSLNERLTSMQSKHNAEIQSMQANLDKKTEDYNNKDKEYRNKENQSMLERMNLKARIEELSNNIDSQNKEIISLKESNKK